jgi:hypothetical protein
MQLSIQSLLLLQTTTNNSSHSKSLKQAYFAFSPFSPYFVLFSLSRDVDPSTLSSLVMFSFPFSSPRAKSQNLLLEDQVLMMRTETILSDPRNFHTLPRPNSCPNHLARINSLRSRETAKDNRECRLAA